MSSIQRDTQYLLLATQLAYLVAVQLRRTEDNLSRALESADAGAIRKVIDDMPALISLVNIVGYLRGQDAMFLEWRPEVGPAEQSELYQNEQALEEQLTAVIDRLMASRFAGQYQQRLEEYFVESRGTEPRRLSV